MQHLRRQRTTTFLFTPSPATSPVAARTLHANAATSTPQATATPHHLLVHSPHLPCHHPFPAHQRQPLSNDEPSLPIATLLVCHVWQHTAAAPAISNDEATANPILPRQTPSTLHASSSMSPYTPVPFFARSNPQHPLRRSTANTCPFANWRGRRRQWLRWKRVNWL